MFDSKKIDWVFKRVKDRLKDGDEKYEDTHFLSDVAGKDMQEELLDLVGYFVVAVVRHLQVCEKVHPEIDRVHFSKFIPEQKDDFLLTMHKYLEDELVKRGIVKKRALLSKWRKR